MLNGTGGGRAKRGTTMAAHAVGALVRNGEQLRRGTRITMFATYEELIESAALMYLRMEITSTEFDSQTRTWKIHAQDIQRLLKKTIFDPASSLNVRNLGAGHPITLLLKALTSTGRTAPATAPTVGLAGLGAGNVDNGTHSLVYTFVGPNGEGSPSSASSVVTVTDKTVNGKIAVSGLLLGPEGTTHRKIYMTAAGDTGNRKHAGTVPNNTATTHTIDVADANLGPDVPLNGANGPYDTESAEDGAGVAQQLVDIAGLEKLRDLVVPGFTMEFHEIEPQEVHDWMETQILRPLNCAVKITQDGKISALQFGTPPFRGTATLLPYALVEP
jgi:hypothetical protein